MAWSIEDIERDLLGGKIDTIALPPATLIEAVNRAETVLGSEWIASFGSAKGLAPAMEIVGTGLRLVSLEGLAQSDKLITEIRRKDSSADAELTAIHLFRSSDPLTEIELYRRVSTTLRQVLTEFSEFFHVIRTGLLIQTSLGRAGGLGALRTKRSG